MRISPSKLRYSVGESDLSRAHAISDFIHSPPIKRGGMGPGGLLCRELAARVSVYAIGTASGHPIKIGFSRRPRTRLVTLQIGSPEELKFHLLCWMPSRMDAKALEKRCHKMLDHCHIRGEWFNLDVIGAAKVIDSAAVAMNIHLVPHRQLTRRFPASVDPMKGYLW